MTVGSELKDAREQAGLTVEQLSATTRIRAGLVTAMEADDFTGCGGAFYTRGHLRAIAAVLGIDPAPLVAEFEQNMPQPQVDRDWREDHPGVRQPTLHPARPRWAVVLAALLVGLLGWGMIRLFTLPGSGQASVARSSPTVVGTKPVAKPVAVPPAETPTVRSPSSEPTTRRLRLTLTAGGDGSYVTVRNIHGRRLFNGLLGPGSSHNLSYPGSVRVTLGDRDNVGVQVNGRPVAPAAARFTISVGGVLDDTP